MWLLATAISSTPWMPHSKNTMKSSASTPESALHLPLIDFAQSLELSDWQFFDVAYLDSDPKNPETLQQLNEVIDRYIQRAEGLPNQEMLQQRGKALRQRVQEIGFHGATALVQLGVNSCTPLELAAQLFKYFAP
jgi:hypothetical protein